MSKPEHEPQTPRLDARQPLDDIARLHRHPERVFRRPDRLFPLLLGPSAIGKSTVIAALNAASGNQFEYISPYMTRELRPGETDKKSISPEEFEARREAGEFVFINPLYGVLYGTPLAPIQAALAAGRMPILDFPLDKAPLLQRPEYDVVGIYLFPPTVESWLDRITQSGRALNGRLQAGLDELHGLMQATQPHPTIDFAVVNDEVERTAGEILTYIEEIRHPNFPAFGQIFP